MDSDGPCSSSFDFREFRTLNGSVRYWLTSHVEGACDVVFLGGLGTDHRLFTKQFEAFDGKYNCLAWDAPSFGQSRPFDMSWTLEDKARWLHELLAEEGFFYPVLVGQGIGAHVAQVYMDMFPGEVPGFIGIGSTPLKRSYYSEHDISRLRHTFGKFISVPRGLLFRRCSTAYASTGKAQALMRDMIDGYAKREFVNLSAHGYAESANAIEQDRRYKVHCPACIICGSRDGIGSTKRLARAWSEQDNIPLHWIEGAGHIANCDDPQKVNAVIDDFLSGLKHSE